MTPEQFVYWLQGYSELAGEKPTAEAWKSIQDHLNLVLKKVTPPKADEKKVTIGDFIVNPSGRIPATPITTLPYPQPQPQEYWLKDSMYPRNTLTC